MQESSIGVQPRRVLQSAEASVLQSAQNRVGRTEELRRKSLAVLARIHSSHRNGSTPDPGYESRVADHRPNQ